MNYFSKSGVSYLVLYEDDICSKDTEQLKSKLIQMLPLLSKEVVLSVLHIQDIHAAALSAIVSLGWSLRETGKHFTLKSDPAGTALFRFLGLEKIANLSEEKAA